MKFKRPRRWLPSYEEIREDVKCLLKAGGDPDLIVYGDPNGGLFIAEDFGLKSFRDLAIPKESGNKADDELIYGGQGDSRHRGEEATNILTAQDSSD